MSQGPAHQARVGLGSSHSRCQQASVVAAFPRSVGSGESSDMRGGGTAAALRVLLASVLWITVQSQQRGEPRGGGNTGDPRAGERERAGAAGQSSRRWGGRSLAHWRSADLRRAARGWDVYGGRPPRTLAAPLCLQLWFPLAPGGGGWGTVPCFLASAGPCVLAVQRVARVGRRGHKRGRRLLIQHLSGCGWRGTAGLVDCAPLLE